MRFGSVSSGLESRTLRSRSHEAGRFRWSVVGLRRPHAASVAGLPPPPRRRRAHAQVYQRDEAGENAFGQCGQLIFVQPPAGSGWVERDGCRSARERLSPSLFAPPQPQQPSAPPSRARTVLAKRRRPRTCSQVASVADCQTRPCGRAARGEARQLAADSRDVALPARSRTHPPTPHTHSVVNEVRSAKEPSESVARKLRCRFLRSCG